MKVAQHSIPLSWFKDLIFPSLVE